MYELRELLKCNKFHTVYMAKLTYDDTAIQSITAEASRRGIIRSIDRSSPEAHPLLYLQSRGRHMQWKTDRQVRSMTDSASSAVQYVPSLLMSWCSGVS